MPGGAVLMALVNLPAWPFVPVAGAAGPHDLPGSVRRPILAVAVLVALVVRDHAVIEYGSCGVSEPLRRIFFELLETSEAHPRRVRYLGDLNDIQRLGKLTPQGAIEKRCKLLGPFRGTARIDLGNPDWAASPGPLPFVRHILTRIMREGVDSGRDTRIHQHTGSTDTLKSRTHSRRQ